MEKQLFVKTACGFQQNYYYVDRAERTAIEGLAREFYHSVSSLIEQAWGIVLEEYLPSVPKHLHWQMGNFLSNQLNHFVTCALQIADREGVLSKPDETNKEWLSLFASE